jgi:hypothetical protein
MSFGISPLMTALLLCCGCAVAQAGSGTGDAKTAPAENADWFSYRNIYREMIWFDKYGKPKNFIQHHYRIIPKDKNASLDGLRLTLNSSSIQVNLPLDAYGRTVFPMLKAAFDENAELRLNRKAAAYYHQPWVSIISRADGIYESADLRTACEQVLAYRRYAGDIALRDKKCVGVKFSYLRGSPDPAPVFRHAGQTSSLPESMDSRTSPTEAGGIYKSFSFLFSHWPQQGQIIASSMPIAIDAVFE